MKKHISFIFTALLTMMSSSAGAAPNKSPEGTRAALNLIRQFANEMCEQVPLSGSRQRLELSGEMNAKLKGVVKAALDAGFSGAAKYSTGDYSGLLQRDLLAAQHNLNDCRKHYFDNLKDKLLSSNSISPNPSSADSAKVSLTIDDFSFDAKSKTLNLRGVFSNTLSNPVTVTEVSFSARHDERHGMLVIAEPQWTPVSLPPRTAITHSFAVVLPEQYANEFAQPANLPQQIFVNARAVDSRGNASATTKHFMTWDYSKNCHCVIGKLFAMPLAILKNTTPIYTSGKNVFIVVRGLMPAID